MSTRERITDRVMPHEACPRCKETRRSHLHLDEDLDTFTCTACGTEYVPGPPPEDNCPSVEYSAFPSLVESIDIALGRYFTCEANHRDVCWAHYNKLRARAGYLDGHTDITSIPEPGGWTGPDCDGETNAPPKTAPRFWLHNTGRGNSYRPVDGAQLKLRPEIAEMVAALVEDGAHPTVAAAIVAITVREHNRAGRVGGSNDPEAQWRIAWTPHYTQRDMTPAEWIRRTIFHAPHLGHLVEEVPRG